MQGNGDTGDTEAGQGSCIRVASLAEIVAESADLVLYQLL